MSEWHCFHHEGGPQVFDSLDDANEHMREEHGAQLVETDEHDGWAYLRYFVTQ